MAFDLVLVVVLHEESEQSSVVFLQSTIVGVTGSVLSREVSTIVLLVGDDNGVGLIGNTINHLGLGTNSELEVS